jgi:putative modified peptide
MATQDNARKLLQRLAEDDDFRARMEADPVAAFAEHGFTLDPDILPDKKITLPPKDEIERNIDKMSRQLEATSGWIVFCR